MAYGLANVSEGFNSGFNMVNNYVNESRRTELLQNADRRAQETHDQAMTEHKTVLDATNEIAKLTQDHAVKMEALGHDQPAAQGLQQSAVQPSTEQSAASADLADNSQGAQPAPAAPVAAPGVKPKSKMMQHVDAANGLLDKIIPLAIKAVQSTAPQKAVEYGMMMANANTRNELARKTALMSTFLHNPDDPDIRAALPEVFPGAIPESYHVLPPDAKGNRGYAQFTIQNPDGTTKEIGLNPAQVKATMISTLSPAAILGQANEDRKLDQKDAETKGQVENWQGHLQLGKEQLAQHIAQFSAELPLRTMQAGAMADNAATNKLYRQSIAEEKASANESRQGKEGVEAAMKLIGATPATIATDPELQGKATEIIGGINSMAQANGKKLDAATATQLGSIYMQLKSGKIGFMYQKGDKYFANTGDPKNPIEVPSYLLPQQPKGAGLTKP